MFYKRNELKYIWAVSNKRRHHSQECIFNKPCLYVMKTAKWKAKITSKPVYRLVMRHKRTTDNCSSLLCAIVFNGSLRVDGEFSAS